MFTQSALRVQNHTSPEINEKIAEAIKLNIFYYAKNLAKIPGRLESLDKEWDIERALDTASSALTSAGLLLGAKSDRRWLFLSAGVQAFFMQHALQGWCPPLAILRDLGFRTTEEINRERFALKALRGDFAQSSVGEAGPEKASVRASTAIAMGNIH